MTEQEYVEEPSGGYVQVPSSMITPGVNPYASGWFEIDPEDEWGLNMIPTSDRSPVSGKTYYIIEGVNAMPSTAIAYSTYQTYLMYRTTSSGTYTKLIDIKDYPDMLGDPNMLNCETLSDKQEKKIPGILRIGDGFPFTANYTPTNFSTVRGLEGNQYDYALWLGGTSAGVPDGHNGKFSWTGDVKAGFSGKGVDEVQEMTITAIPSTDVEWSAT